MICSIFLAIQVAHSGVLNDDRDVIQAALLTFFHHEKWHSSDWKPKFHVVLRTQYWSKAKPNFDQDLKDLKEERTVALAQCQKELKSKDAQATDRRVRIIAYMKTAEADIAALKAMPSTEGSFVPPEVVPLRSLSWDSRILVTDKANRLLWPDKDRDPSLEEWTIYAQVARPSYSKDGRFAFVRFGIPWSMHSADVTFLMERTAKGWIQKVVTSRFYV